MVIKDLLDCKEYVYPRDADLSRRGQLKYNRKLQVQIGHLMVENEAFKDTVSVAFYISIKREIWGGSVA